MPVSKAQIKASDKYKAKTYYRPSINLRREYEEAIRERAAELNMTMSTYIQTLIKKDLDQHIL